MCIWLTLTGFGMPFRIGRPSTRARDDMSLMCSKLEVRMEAGGAKPAPLPDWHLLLDMSQISNLCDEEPEGVTRKLKQQGRRDVRVEQRTLDSLGVRFNIIEYKSGGKRKRTFSVRGTKTFNNIFQNMDAAFVYDKKVGIRAHSGYMTIARAMAEELQASKLCLDDDLPLSLTGHSLGGAVSVLLGALLKSEGFSIEGIYTFGMPKSFVDRDGALKLKEALPVIVQTEHILDPICSGTNRASAAAATAAAAATEAVPLLQNLTESVPLLQDFLKPVQDIIEPPAPFYSSLVLFVPEGESTGNNAADSVPVRVFLDDKAEEEWRVVAELEARNPFEPADGPRSDLPPIQLPKLPSLEFHSMRCYESCLESMQEEDVLDG